MDYFWNGNYGMQGGGRQRMLTPIYGTITEIQDLQSGGSGQMGCTKLVTVEEPDGNVANFVVGASTVIVDYVTLYEGEPVIMFYDPMVPMPLIYPPRYRAVVVAEQVEGVQIAAGYFDRKLLSADRNLQLRLDADTLVVTANNQTFSRNPGGRDLIVLYENTTRSIPAQTTPSKVIVMC